MSHAATGPPGRGLLQRALAHVGVPFFLVACTLIYYGQLHRAPSGDTTGAVYTAVALVKERTIWLDEYLPLFQERYGERPYMLDSGRDWHVVSGTPVAGSLLALPVVGVFALAGVEAEDWDAWMEAGMLTAALATAASVALLFLLLTRLTSTNRARLIAATYAVGTMAWGIAGQSLWQHTGAMLALIVTLLGLVDRRHALAGGAVGSMIAFRLSTPVIAVFLLPLVGRARRDWLRFSLGAAAPLAILAGYNWAAFGSPLRQGYGTGHVTSAIGAPLALGLVVAAGVLAARAWVPRRWWLGTGLAALCAGAAVALVMSPSKVVDITQGAAGLMASPGRGLVVYTPVLAFALVGAVRGWRTPIYRWTALAAMAYIVVASNSPEWFGGESFGPRRLAEAVPLLAVLLVPALDAIAGTRWRWLFAATLVWSVLVQLLAAANWPPDTWYAAHDLKDTATWWSPFDSELTGMLSDSGAAVRVFSTAVLVGAAVALGLLANALYTRLRQRRPSAKRWLVGGVGLLTIVLAVALAYPVQDAGCTQTSHLALTRALGSGTSQIDDWHGLTCDKAWFEGHFYSVKAPGLAVSALPLYVLLDTTGLLPDSPGTQAWLLGLVTVLPAALLLAWLTGLVGSWVTPRSGVLAGSTRSGSRRSHCPSGRSGSGTSPQPHSHSPRSRSRSRRDVPVGAIAPTSRPACSPVVRCCSSTRSRWRPPHCSSMSS